MSIPNVFMWKPPYPQPPPHGIFLNYAKGTYCNSTLNKFGSSTLFWCYEHLKLKQRVLFFRYHGNMLYKKKTRYLYQWFGIFTGAEADLGGVCRGCTSPSPEMRPSSSYLLLKFGYLTSQLRNSLVVHYTLHWYLWVTSRTTLRFSESQEKYVLIDTV